jgi:uncharacterized protein with PIN domain
VRAKPEVRYVLDASAVLAYLQQEMGYEKVREALERKFHPPNQEFAFRIKA